MKINNKQKRLIISISIITVLSAALCISVWYKHYKRLPSYNLCDISYGPYSENTMDVSLPEGRTEATPVIILVHGGAWTGGDKKDFSFLRGYFSDKDFAVFSVNYRLARIKGSGIGNILEDMDKVFAYVKEKSGCWKYSRDSIFLVGYSAGGHIVLLYTFSTARERTVRGAVSLCGIADLTDPELKKFLKRMQENEDPHAKKAFDRIEFVAGPDRSTHVSYSPLFIKRNVPVLLFCGKKDRIIPWKQSENLHIKMKESGFDSTLYVYPDMGHDITGYYGEIMKITEKWILNRI